MAPRRTRIFVAVIGVWVFGTLFYCWHRASLFAQNVSSASPPSIPPFSPSKKLPADELTNSINAYTVDKWEKQPVRYRPNSIASLPAVKIEPKLRPVQAAQPKEDASARRIRLERLAAVKESFQHSWKGYKEAAWMHDEIRPIIGAHKDPFAGWAATLVDSLDTLWIMGLKDEFEEAVEACAHIDFTTTTARDISVFETTIRYLGGFLSAYELSGKRYPTLLAKALEVAELMMCAFDTPTRMPVAHWNWRRYVAGFEQAASTRTSTAEIGSLSMEFTKVSQLTGDMRFYDAVQRISDRFEAAQQSTSLPGMWPISMDASEDPPSFRGDSFTLGAMADSLYEYFPKQYLLLGGSLAQPLKMYAGFIDVALKHLMRKALNPDRDIAFFGDVRVQYAGLPKAKAITSPRMQHLTCFSGGMVGLGSRIMNRPEDMEVAAQLTEGCVWSYNVTASGIGPETFTFVPCDPDHVTTATTRDECTWSRTRWYDSLLIYWARSYRKLYKEDPPASTKGDPELERRVEAIVAENRLPDGMANVDDRRYILRPEAIESVFYMHRLTGESKWAESAWDMFRSIEPRSRTEYAAAGIDDVTLNPEDVTDKDPEWMKMAAEKGFQIDSMESFWTGETLKYFYLCFADWDVVDLDTWVLNTEAHPFRRADARESSSPSSSSS